MNKTARWMLGVLWVMLAAESALGSVTAITNASGVMIEKYTYDVFGTPAIYDGTNNLLGASAVGNRFLDTGRDNRSVGTLGGDPATAGPAGRGKRERASQRVAQASLYDYRNRVYSPVLGRFLQTDPIGFAARDVNIYRYVFNNPANLTDPTGEVAPLVAWAAYTGGAMLVDWLYDKYVDPHVEELIDEYVDCETQETVRTAKDLLDLARMLKNPAKLGIKGLGKGAPKSEVSLAERILAADRTGNGLKADASHRAASFLTKEQLEAGTSFTIKGGDGVARELLQTPGGMNGKSGIFEYILDPTKGVTHQRFIPGGKITGVPNQKVP